MARTIATLSEVASARVHIAMGKEELFGESRPATASVVLKLKRRPLAAGQRRQRHHQAGRRARWTA